MGYSKDHGVVQHFSTIKLFKACNFCRKRKIKCVVKRSNVCEGCKEHNEPCVFEHKTIFSHKGEVKQGERISKIEHSNTLKEKSSQTKTNTAKEIEIPISLSNRFELDLSNLDFKNIYHEYIEPLTSFIPAEVFSSDPDKELDKFSRICISIAKDFRHSSEKLYEDSDYEFLIDYIRKGAVEWDMKTISCFFLLPLRIKFPLDVIRQSLKGFNKLYTKTQGYLPLNLIMGAISVDTWVAFIEPTYLLTSRELKHKALRFIESLEKDSFQSHFFYIIYFLNSFLLLINSDEFPKVKRTGLLKLEYEMLLWPVKLVGDLSLVQDRYDARPEALILHILHNVLLLAYYTNAVEKEEFGKISSISAVPGLYHFLSCIAGSNFRVSDKILYKWAMFQDCNIQSAKLLLTLNKVMDFDFLKVSLKHFCPPQEEAMTVPRKAVCEEVKKLLSDTSYYDAEVDGALIYWVFRDTRSMSLESSINEVREIK